MNHKWENYLSEGEKVEVDFGISNLYSNLVLIITTVVAIIMTFTNLFVGVGVLLLGILYWFYLTRGKRYALTNKKVILLDSFLGKNVINIKYENITDITLNQNAIELAAGWGNILINTAGTGFHEATLQFVSNPQQIKNKLDELAEASKKG